MTLVCIIVVLPLIMVLLFLNIVQGAPWNLPYDFDALHFGPDPFNVYFISFTTTDMMSFSSLNIAYIGEIAGIAVFIPFGTTPEALNMYRGLLLSAGLGYVFPKLKKEYVPHAKRGGSSFSWGSLTSPLRGMSLLGTRYVSRFFMWHPLILTTHTSQLIVHPQGLSPCHRRANLHN
jgi:pheromone a factor receptor